MKIMNNELLRELPKVDEMVSLGETAIKTIQKEKGLPERVNLSLLTRSARKIIEDYRQGVMCKKIESLPGKGDFADEIVREYFANNKHSLQRVINGSGITLHTNLGRGILCESAAKAIVKAASGYTNLEYNIEEGKRGSRYDHVEELLCRLTGAESAVVVNNNAGAVMLLLHSLGYKKKMIISRGELVEIGGSFRIPTVMEISGVELKEVGTTNKTSLADYEDAIDGDTVALLKVHTSNFVIKGFTSGCEVKEMAALAHSKGLPLIYDMGSGALCDLEIYSHEEPLVGQALEKGADIVCFSGDKLLGGPQCGIICGKKEYVDKVKKDNLIRTLRIDKLSLAALGATLEEYDNKTALDNIPTLSMIAMGEEELKKKQTKLAEAIGTNAKIKLSLIDSVANAGGGSLPEVELPSKAVAIEVEGLSANDIERTLRLNEDVAVIGRIHEELYMIDVRCLLETDYEDIAKAVNGLI